MDNTPLVDQQKDAGAQLLERLRSVDFDVTVAVWILITNERQWRLYIASAEVTRIGLAAAFRVVNIEIGKLNNPWVQNSDVRLIGGSESVAVAAVRNGSERFATNFGGRTLGDVIIDDAYIYPLSGASIHEASC
jgi:hypothetical protein